MAIGAMNRSARVSPDLDLHYRDWVLPKGYPVSMSSYWMYNDLSISPSPNDSCLRDGSPLNQNR
jgi:hypothetical protein